MSDNHEDRVNVEIRKFLKIVGITSQREIERSIREAQAAGKLPAGAVAASVTLTVPALGLEHVINHELRLDAKGDS